MPCVSVQVTSGILLEVCADGRIVTQTKEIVAPEHLKPYCESLQLVAGMLVWLPPIGGQLMYAYPPLQYEARFSFQVAEQHVDVMTHPSDVPLHFALVLNQMWYMPEKHTVTPTLVFKVRSLESAEAVTSRWGMCAEQFLTALVQQPLPWPQLLLQAVCFFGMQLGWAKLRGILGAHAELPAMLDHLKTAGLVPFAGVEERDARLLMPTSPPPSPVAPARRMPDAGPGVDASHSPFVPEQTLVDAFLERWEELPARRQAMEIGAALDNDTKDDGDCMLDAVNRSLPTQIENLRSRLAEFVLETGEGDLLTGAIVDLASGGSQVDTLEDYAKWLCEPRQWLGDAELRFLAAYLKRDIVVLFHNSRPVQIPGGERGRVVIVMSSVEPHGHYHALRARTVLDDVEDRLEPSTARAWRKVKRTLSQGETEEVCIRLAGSHADVLVAIFADQLAKLRRQMRPERVRVTFDGKIYTGTVTKREQAAYLVSHGHLDLIITNLRDGDSWSPHSQEYQVVEPILCEVDVVALAGAVAAFYQQGDRDVFTSRGGSEWNIVKTMFVAGMVEPDLSVHADHLEPVAEVARDAVLWLQEMGGSPRKRKRHEEARAQDLTSAAVVILHGVRQLVHHDHRVTAPNLLAAVWCQRQTLLGRERSLKDIVAHRDAAERIKDVYGAAELGAHLFRDVAGEDVYTQ